MGVRRHQPHRQPGAVSFEFTKAERRVGDLLLLRPRRRLRAGVHQDLHVLPVSGQGVGQRPRVGQTPSRPRPGSPITALANGFATCDDPAGLQAICDRFGPDDVQGFFDRWIDLIPTPFTAADRAAGYWWELSMRQVEVSRTLVFDDPRRARGVLRSARRRQRRHRPPRTRSTPSSAAAARATPGTSSGPGSSTPAPT